MPAVTDKMPYYEFKKVKFLGLNELPQALIFTGKGAANQKSFPRLQNNTIMTDIATYEGGLQAIESGADILATTLSGYTEETSSRKDGPDLDLVEKLGENVRVPVIAEGRFQKPDQVTRAIELGAHAIVIGTAITNPKAITSRFVAATR